MCLPNMANRPKVNFFGGKKQYLKAFAELEQEYL